MKTKYDVLNREEAYNLEEQVVWNMEQLHRLRRKRISPGIRSDYHQIAEAFARRHYAQGKLHTF